MSLLQKEPDQHITFAPTISTERLVLRAHRPDDWQRLVAMWSEPEVVRHFGGQPRPAEEVWGKLMGKAGHWAFLGYGYWVLEDRFTGALVGEAGFADQKRAIEPPFDGAPEIGWGLTGAYQGKGYASEAIAAIIEWGRTHFGAVRSVCMIHPDNTPSLKLADRFGYKEYARSEYKGEPSVLLERML